jgi:hypothetical protein
MAMTYKQNQSYTLTKFRSNITHNVATIKRNSQN